MAEEIEKLQKRIKEGEKKIVDLEEQNKTLKTKLEEAQGKLAEKAGIENQVKDLQAKLDKFEEERHLERVAELVDLRIQAGLAKDQDAEIEKYKAFDDQTLSLLKGDVEVFIAEKRRFSKLAGPKAKFTAERQDQVKAKMEEIRMCYFGHKGPQEPQQSQQPQELTNHGSRRHLERTVRRFGSLFRGSHGPLAEG